MKTNSILRNVLALVLGGVVGGGVIMAVESVNYVLYPPPADLDFHDPAALATYVESLPVPAFLVVLAAYAVGSFASAWTAARVAAHPLVLGLVLGGLFQIGGIYNFSVIPTPTWMWIAGFAVFIPPAYAGARLGDVAPGI